MKYYEPEHGEITIDGVDINEYSNDSLRRAVSYVPQNIELFSKSIYDNIRVSRMNATLDEVKEAAKAADAHDFIKKLPMQYYTYLEEAGNGLSGGEKQRIALIPGLQAAVAGASYYGALATVCGLSGWFFTEATRKGGCYIGFDSNKKKMVYGWGKYKG